MHRQLAKEKREGNTTPFGRQFNEKPSVIPGCPGACRRQRSQKQAAVLAPEHLASHADLEQDQQGMFGEQAEALKGLDSAATNMFDTREKPPPFSIRLQSAHAQQAQGPHAHVVCEHQDTDK